MIRALAQAAVKDMLSFLRKNPTFFSLTTEEKRAISSQYFTLSPSISSYVTETNELSFMKDLESLLHDLSGIPTKRHLDPTSMLGGFASFLTKDLAELMDSKTTISGLSNFESAVKDVLGLHSPQEVTRAVLAFLGAYTTLPYIVVQSPLALSAEMKKDIRTAMLAKYTYAFPIFTLNKSLIGGMRILVDGQTDDRSWHGRVMNLSHLLYTRT